MNSLSEHTDEQSYVRQFLSSKDNDFGHIVLSVFKSRAFAEDALFPVRLGIHLREKGHFSIANTLFSACLDYSCRASALFELGVLKSITGEVDQSVFYLEMRLKESGLQPHEKVFFARQYARQGRIGRAAALLEEAADLNPHLRHECLVSLQSFKFMNRFDKRVTLGLLEEVKSLYNVYTHESQVERRINEALAKGDPFLLLRMGDGEGSAIRLSIEDDAEYNLLYRDNLEEFTQFWFNDRSIAVDPEFSEVINEFNKVPFEADVIGTFHVSGIDNEYNIGSRRGITWAVNTLRALLKMAELKSERASDIMVGDPNVHYHLFASGALNRILLNRPRVGLISCHSDLVHALKEKFNIGEIEFIKIPAEQVSARVVGKGASEGIHWPDRYKEVRATIANKNRKGWLFLVAAGMLGKIYARDLKASGAIVLDIGSIADALVGKITRTFPNSVQNLIKENT